MHTIQVKLPEQGYPIHIGQGLLQHPDQVARYIQGQQALLVTNKTIAALYANPLLTNLRTQGKHVTLCVLPDGEQYKTIATLNIIFDALLTAKHTRETTLIALGGGVIGDLTGFAAACYQRGVNYIHIPTTLLAQVDSSIGGKTAVNHPLGKNMIGAFHQPRAVIIDVQTLSTLAPRQFNAGFAEIIKCALIRDADFFAWLEQHITSLLCQKLDVLQEAIIRACQIKVDIVLRDVNDQHGERALLNFGHTFAHALEYCMGYGAWLHGEAVATGIIAANQVSQQHGWLTMADTLRVQQLLQQVKLPIKFPKQLVPTTLYAAMQRDKKKRDNALNLILLNTIGNASIYHHASQANIINAIQQTQ